MVSVGDVYSVPLENGAVGLCRVVAAEKPRGEWDTQGRWRVVTCEWVGPRAKVAAAVRGALAPLALTRLQGQAHVQSIGGPPPPTFKRVGLSAPTAADRALRSPKNPGAWVWVETQLKVEREYRADPRAFEAKWAAQVARQKQAQAAERKAVKVHPAPRALGPRTKPPRAPRLQPARVGPARLGLAATRAGPAAPPARRHHAPRAALGRRPRVRARWPAAARDARARFTEWKPHPRAFIGAVRGVVRSLTGKLKAAKSVAGVVAAVKQATSALNRLDEKWGNPVTTPDAEELVEVLVGLAVAAGLDASYAAQVVDAQREF